MASPAEAPALSRPLFQPAIDWLDALGRVVILTGQTIVWALRPPFRPSQLLLAMDFIGVQSIFIIMLTGTFSGMVFSLQTVASLRQFG
ncbi:MAG: ABC transporter permease, partial [Polyangiaceae bacterium]